MKFSIDTKFFYLGWNFKHNFYTDDLKIVTIMEERFGLSIGQYYLGNYVGDGWCFGKLDANGCLIETV